MLRIATILVAIWAISPCINLNAQKNNLQSIDIQMDTTKSRFPLDVYGGQTAIRICGLKPGLLYGLFAVPNNDLSFDDLSIHFQDHDLELDPITRFPGRNAARRFVAPSECIEIIYDLDAHGRTDKQPMFLSVSWLDDPDKNKWTNEFANRMANLTVSGGIPASSLVTNTLIGGNCFDVTGISNGGSQTSSQGTFANGATNVGFQTGVALCTGNVSILPGPNNSASANGGYGNPGNDADLSTLTANSLWDISKIEFDFKPTSPNVSFEFVFGSEEYCEFVGTQYNDVFGFFISGPGFSGNQNIALVPGTNTAVAINNVNHASNTAFYVNNNNGSGCGGAGAAHPAELQLDGHTTVLTAMADVTPCQTYHIKLAVADVGDSQYASAVFLKANSFDAGGIVKAQVVVTGAPASQNFVYEACGTVFIKFFRVGGNINEPVTVDFTIDPASTATEGLDYSGLPNPIIIPAGQTEILVPITVFPDLLVEGDETIIIALSTPCSCTQSTTTLIIKDKPPLEAELVDINACGSSSATLSPTISGGQTPLHYNWSSGQTTQNINVTTSGQYTVTVTDNCGTTATAVSNVTVAPSPTATISGNSFFCAGTTPSVNLNVNLTGVGPWTVTYNHGGSSEQVNFTSSPGVITATEAGTYTLVAVLSDNGCTGTASGTATVTEINLDLTLNSTSPLCGTTNNGTISAVPTGGTAPFTYTWSTGQNTATINGLTGGTYEVTVSESHGCTATDEVTLVQPPNLTVEATTTSNIDCNNPQGSIEVDANGGTPGYDYNWSNGSNGQELNTSTPGNYTVTVVDDNGCTKTASAVITANTTLPTAVATVPGQINCNNSEITINGNGSSAGPDFEYEWTGPSITCCENTLNPTVDQGGTYTLIVTNSVNGCTKQVSVTVQENTNPPAININAPQNIGCTTPNVTISGAGSATGAAINYAWSTNDGNIVSGASTLNPVVNQAGTYTLVVTNNNTGCTAEESVTVEGNTIQPDAIIAAPDVVNCFNPEITIDGSGSSSGSNIDYAWSASPGQIVSGADTPTPTVSAAGTYTLTVTDTDNNCTSTATVSVSANLVQPNAVAANPPLINCTNPTITINGTGSTTGPNIEYEWTTSGGNIVSGENTLTPQVDAEGTYTLLVTNTANGCTDEVEVEVNLDQNFPEADAGNDITLNCTQPTLQIQGSGSTGAGYTLQWTPAPGNITAGANTFLPTVNQPGTYVLVVTNNTNGCTAEDDVEVTENFQLPTAFIEPPEEINCYQTEIDLDASNSYGNDLSFQWAASPGSIVSGQNDPNPTVNQAGTYNLTITDAENGCTDVANIQVFSNLVLPIAQAGPTAELDCQNQELELNGNGTSIGPNIEYEWSTYDGNIVSGETTLNPTVDQAGEYTLLVTNQENGCTAEDNVVVTADQNLPEADAGEDKALDCSNLSVVLQGGNSTTGAGIVYQWITFDGNIVSGGNTRFPKVDAPGTYTLVVSNPANGCSTEDEVSVEDNIIYPEALILPADLLDCANTTITIDASGSTQNGSTEFQWTTVGGNFVDGEDSPTPEVDKAGTYTLIVTNIDNTCTATAQVVVSQDVTKPLAVAAADNELTCQYPQVNLNGSGSSEGYQFFYQWTTTNGQFVSGQATLNPIVNQPGLYTLVVTNAENSCTKMATVTVATNQAFPTATVAAPPIIDCNNSSVTLSGAGSSSGSAYSYVWFTQNGNIVSGGNTLTPVVDAPGVYDLSVINTVTGCTSTISALVNTNLAAPTATVAPGGVLSCSVTSINLSGAGSSSGNNYSYTWETTNGNILSGANTLTPSVNAIGTYTLIVKNLQNGCTAEKATTVTADASLPLANAGQPDTLNCVVAQTTLNASNSSQGNNFIYLWTGPGIVNGSTSLTPVVNQPGQYNLQVTNTTNGCKSISTVDIVQNIQIPTAEAGLTAVLNCTTTQLTLDGSLSSAGPIFQYNWTTTGGNIVSGNNTVAPVVNQPGTYNLLVTNAFNGCTKADNVVITQNITPPTAEAGNTALIDCTHPTTALNGSGSTGNNFSYLWTTTNGNIASGSTSLSPVVDAPGTYVLVVTNETNQCTATDNVNITKDANIPLALGVPSGELTCAVSEITINANSSSQGPGITYTWTTNNGAFVAGQNTLSPTVSTPGQYSLTVLNTANNCQAVSTINVLQNIATPVADAGVPAVISCTNALLTLDGSGSSTGNQYVYQWSTQTGNFVGASNILTPQIDQSGFYNLVVTDNQNGCTQTATVQILLDQNTPEADAGPAQVLDCNNATLTLNGTGSSTGSIFTYAWSAAQGGNIVSGNNGLTPVVNQPGVYTLLVSNPNNGCTATESVAITKDVVAPLASIAAPAILNCQTTETTLDAQYSSAGSNFQYNWTTTGGNIVAGNNTLQPVIDNPGVYNLLITNTQNGCTKTASTTVTENVSYPTVDAGPTDILSCTHISSTLAGTMSGAGNNFSVTWTTNNGNIVSGANTLTPVVNAVGVYTLTVQNNENFCLKTDNVVITQDNSLPVAVGGNASTLTCSITETTLNGVGSSAGPSIVYEWTGPNVILGANTLNPTVGAPGVYSLTVINNDNQCQTVATVTVPQNIAAPLANAGAPVTLTCSQASLKLDGSGSATGTQYSYNWTTSNGVLWSGATTLTPTITSPGTYDLMVTDNQNGCTSLASTQVLQDLNAPTSIATAPGELTCSVTALSLSGTGSSTGTQYGYQWLASNGGNIVSGETTLSPVVNKPGLYKLQITDGTNGCSTVGSVTVTENKTLPQVEAGPNGLLTCAVKQLNLNGTASGGAQGVTYVWTASNGGVIVSGNNTLTPVVNADGIYTLTATDTYNGCTNTDELQVLTNTILPVAVVAPPVLLTCNVVTAQLNADGQNPGTQFTYAWSGNNSSFVTDLDLPTTSVNAPGVYSVLVTNTETGCTQSANVTVAQDIQAPNAKATGFELTCSVLQKTISSAGSSVGNNFTYQWATQNGHFINGLNSATPLVDEPGTYSLLVTNTATGCTNTTETVVTRNTNYPTALDVYQDPPACGGYRGTVRVDEITGGVEPYLYSFDNGETFSDNTLFANLLPGEYDLVVQDANGCELPMHFKFPVPIEPAVETVPLVELEFGETQTLVANINIPLSQVDSIIWSPTDGLTFTSKPNEVIVQGFQLRQYTVRIINKDGCEDRAVVLVKVDDPAIWTPNVIKPETGENNNNWFTIFAKDNTVRQINTLRIYDRWGDGVFKADNFQPNDPQKGWNGFFNGQKMNPAVFVWWAEVELIDGKMIFLKGDVTIID